MRNESYSRYVSNIYTDVDAYEVMDAGYGIKGSFDDHIQVPLE